MPKRIGYILPELVEDSNLQQAYHKSRRGKTYVYSLIKNQGFNPDETLEKLKWDFINGTYKTSDYTTFKIYEPKERTVFRLPYNPDRIAHHAIMNVLEQFWVNKMLPTSFSCVKGRGVHGVVKYMKKILTKDPEGTKYCLKMDIKKFFPNIDHRVLKQIISKHIKDQDVLNILYEIIDSTNRYFYETKQYNMIGKSIPIGNYLSQFFANIVLAEYSRSIHRIFKNVYVIIYMDDIVILASNKATLHKIRKYSQDYLHKLKLEIKSNYQVFPVDDRGIDFVGYKFYHTHILLRKNLKLRITKTIRRYINSKITAKDFKNKIQAYYGWMKYCNSKNYLKKLYYRTGIHFSNWNGITRKITDIKNLNIRVYNVKKYAKWFRIECMINNIPSFVISTNKALLRKLNNIIFPTNLILNRI